MTRSRFLGLSILAGAALALIRIELATRLGWPRIDGLRDLPDAPPLLIALPLAVLVLQMFFVAARLRDIGRSAWWTWLLPLAALGATLPGPAGIAVDAILILGWIVLWLWPGTIGPNRHGPDPRAWESPEHFERQRQALAADAASARRGGAQYRG